MSIPAGRLLGMEDTPDVRLLMQELAALRTKTSGMRRALDAACGYLLNAKIDLETGCTKATAIRTIEGGLATMRDAIAQADQ